MSKTFDALARACDGFAHLATLTDLLDWRSCA